MAWTERYVRADASGGGDGTADNSTDAWTLAEAIAGHASGQRINIKKGTYPLSAGDTAFATGGVWWRGFDSTIGDLENVLDSTNYPFFDGTGLNARLVSSGTDSVFQNIRIWTGQVQGARGVFYNTARAILYQCDIEQDADNVNGYAYRSTGTADGTSLIQCRFSAHANASAVVGISTSAQHSVIGCDISGALVGIEVVSGSSIHKNLIHDTGKGIVNVCNDTQSIGITGNSFYDISSDGVECTLTSASCLIANNMFSVIGGYAINSSGGTAGGIAIVNNLYHAITSGQLNGIRESLQVNAQTDGSSPFVNAVAGDFRLASGSNAIGNAMGSLFGLGAGGENFLDIGALQKECTGGGGGPSAYGFFG